MTPQEFAAKIRTKYPDGVSSDGRKYTEIADDELVSKITEKYPVYKTQIKSPGYAERLTTDVAGDIEKRTDKVGEILSRKDTGVIEKATQVLGQGSGMAANVLEKTVEEIPGVKKAVETVGSGINWLATSKLSPIKYLGDVIGSSKALQEATRLYDTDENFKDTVDAVANIARLGLDIEGVVSGSNFTKNVTSKVKGAVEEAVPKIAKTTEEIVAKGKTGVEGVYRTAKEIVEKPSKTFKEIVEKPLPKPVENVLSETPSIKFDEYINTAKKAVESYKNPTPLEIAGKKAEDALNLIQNKLSNYGKLKSGSMSTFGDKNVGTIATKFKQSLESFTKNKTFVDGDIKLVKNLTEKAKILGNNPTASQVDEFIDYAQDALYTSGRDLTVPVTDSTTATIRKILGELNEGLKNEMPASYKSFNKKYSDLVSVRDELNSKLGKEGERGGSLMKRVFSPSDANTKELFSRVLKETGVDLINESTLARFAMEVMGDARQSSILEQLKLPSNISKKGLLDFIWDKATESVNTPEKIIERARAKTKQ